MAAVQRGQVVSQAAVVAAVGTHRAAGRRVVFTNGAFDLLHVGHVRLLRAAAALGDVLVVGINDDAAVRASRGPGRPIVPAAERAEIVAAVEGVDLVFVFSEATVDRWLTTLRPTVHAKGTEYAEATHPEAATNRALGIRMEFVGDKKSHAATDLAARAAAAAGSSADRAVETSAPGARGLALLGKEAFLRSHGLGDLASLLATTAGVEIHRHATRFVRRIEITGDAVFVKVEHPARKGATATDEFRNHLALRAAGLRAAEPWLALEGKAPDGRKARALVTREVRGAPLDEFLRTRFESADARDRASWARGIGRALRALHTARFLHPDLHAHHLVVDGTPAGGAPSIQWIDLARVERATSRIEPTEAAPGLAALALTLRPVTTARFRLAILRAYLGGSLEDARPWLRALERRVARVEGRGSYRPRPTKTP